MGVGWWGGSAGKEQINWRWKDGEGEGGEEGSRFIWKREEISPDVNIEIHLFCKLGAAESAQILRQPIGRGQSHEPQQGSDRLAAQEPTNQVCFVHQSHSGFLLAGQIGGTLQPLGLIDCSFLNPVA